MTFYSDLRELSGNQFSVAKVSLGFVCNLIASYEREATASRSYEILEILNRLSTTLKYIGGTVFFNWFFLKKWHVVGFSEAQTAKHIDVSGVTFRMAFDRRWNSTSRFQMVIFV